MGTFFAFFGTLLLSQFVALLAALQLADYFRATEEFIGVMMLLMLLSIVTIVIFAVVYAVARSRRAFDWLPIVSAVLIVAAIAFLEVFDWFVGRSGKPFDINAKSIQVLLEMLVPALITVLVQWGLVRRRWLKRRGEDDLSRWPWVTTIVVGLAVLNPAALSLLTAAARFSGTDWLREPSTRIALGGAVALLVMIWIEIATRGRILRRRHPANL